MLYWRVSWIIWRATRYACCCLYTIVLLVSTVALLANSFSEICIKLIANFLSLSLFATNFPSTSSFSAVVHTRKEESEQRTERNFYRLMLSQVNEICSWPSFKVFCSRSFYLFSQFSFSLSLFSFAQIPTNLYRFVIHSSIILRQVSNVIWFTKFSLYPSNIWIR
jgi:hypothetical protein